MQYFALITKFENQKIEFMRKILYFNCFMNNCGCNK